MLCTFLIITLSLRKKNPYSELFWSAFFPHFPAFGLNTSISPYSVRMQKNAVKMLTGITPNTESFYAGFHVAIFSCYTLVTLHFSRITAFSCWFFFSCFTFFKLYFFHVKLFHIALFLFTHFKPHSSCTFQKHWEINFQLLYKRLAIKTPEL